MNKFEKLGIMTGQVGITKILLVIEIDKYQDFVKADHHIIDEFSQASTSNLSLNDLKLHDEIVNRELYTQRNYLSFIDGLNFQ